MEKQIQILHLEDDAIDAELVQAALNAADLPFQITRVQTEREFSDALRRDGYDLILADYSLPGYDGLSALKFVREQHLNIPFIFVSGTLGEDAAISALTEGAIDYVTKLKLSRLAPAVRRALRESENQTKRRQAEEELKRSNALLERIFSTTEFMIAYLDADFNFIRVNRAYAEADNQTPEFFVGKNHFALYPDLDNEAIFRQVVKTGVPYIAYAKPFVYEGSPERGVTYWNWTLHPLKGADGRVNELVFSLVNVTERERALIAQREIDERYRTLVEQASDGIFIADPNGNYIDVNLSGCAMLGYTREEVLKLNMKQLASPKSQSEIPLQFDELRSGKSITTERLLVTKSGALLPVEISGKMLDNGNLIGIVRDITERKQAEEALRESERRLSEAQRIAHIGYWERNFEAGRIILSYEACRIFGLAPQEVPFSLEQWHQRWLGLIHPEDQSRASQATTDALGDGPPYNVDYRIVLPDGEVRFIHSEASVRRDESGRPRYMLGMMQDITERKQAEEALRKSEQKFRALAENIPNVVYQCRNDPLYTFLYLNEAVENLTGYPREDFLEKGLSFFDLYHPDDLPNIPAPIEGNITNINRSPFHITYRIRHKSGDWRWVDEWGVGVTNAGGEVDYIEGIMVDITEQKRSEQTLRESEERYRQLVELSPDAIGTFSDGKIVFVNSATVRMVGAKSADELIGLSFIDFVHPDFKETARENLENLDATQKDTPFVEAKLLRPDGVSLNVEAAAIPFDYQGKRHVQIIARDITERKRHEREREAIITVSAALRQATKRSEIILNILEQLSVLFDADGTLIAIPNSPTGEVIVQMGYGPVGERFNGLRLPRDKSVSGWVIANRKAYLNDNAHLDPLFYRPDLLGECHCVASVPLIARDQSIGALWIARKFSITEQDLRLLNAIADIAANAIHRVTLYEQTEQQLHHLLALHQIDLAISTNFELNVTLEIILTYVQSELGVDASSLLLLNPSTNVLEYVAGLGFNTGHIKETNLKLGDGVAGRAALEQRTITCPDIKKNGEIFSRPTLLTAEAFEAHYATPLLVQGQVKGVLEIFHRSPFEPDQEWTNYFETLATQAAIAIDNASLLQNLQRTNQELTEAYDATIEGWSRALDLRDRETEGHTQRVTEMALKLAEKIGMSETEKADMRRGALLHDIGKMGVPDSILHKPGGLNDSEWKIMRQHPSFAYQMLSPIPYLRQAIEISYCHHEKWDGTGYPHGLKGEEIPLAARVFAVADVFDALTSDRPYRKAWTEEEAYSYIESHAGTHFDPQIVKVFLDGRKK